MAITPVSVNPSSATHAASNAVSGGGDTSFYFGPNPNVAAIFGGNKSQIWWIAGTVAGAIALYVLLRRRT